MQKTLVTVLLSSSLVEAVIHTVPLIKSSVPVGYAALKKRQFASGPSTQDQFFWFGQFDIGSAKNAKMLIDTGSPDLIFNLNAYKPGPGSQDLHSNFSIAYSTTNSDGSGFEEPIGVTTSWTPMDKLPFPGGEGLIAFGELGSTLGDDVIGWFNKLCVLKVVGECRFGLAFGTNGNEYYGGVEESFRNKLTVAPIAVHWALYGDMAVNGKVIQNDIPIQIDSGTTTIFGPIDQVQTLFNVSGIESVYEKVDNVTALTGYYPCDEPPQLGFQFPSFSNRTSANKNSSSLVSRTGKVFNIAPEGLRFNATENRCRSVIQWFEGQPNWLFGQAFMEGKYIDHNWDEGTIGFAILE